MKIIREFFTNTAKSIAFPRLSGQVISVSSGEVLCWISANKTIRDVQIQVFVNGNEITSTSTPYLPAIGVLPRLEIRIGMPKKFVLSADDIVEVKFTIGQQHLAGSPWKINQVIPSAPLIFLHIPKTAGTSVRSTFEVVLGPEKVLPSSRYLKLRGGKYLSATELKSALKGVHAQLCLIQGHMSFSDAKELSPRGRFFSMLRKPVARSFSLLNHLRIRHGIDGSYESLIAPDGQAHWQIKNYQTRLLSGLPRDAAPADQLAAAKENLRKFFAIGLTERYQESIAVWERLLGLPLSGENYLNKSIASEIPSENLTSMLEDMTELDNELYEFAECLFEKQLSR